ncbi:MAG TPA: ABC transporter permease [Bryobacteraceae bacterium]|nr:ABC transporter permease [Bryobacteraceae bacterium]
MLSGIKQDIRYAIRGLCTSPGFAAVAILSLALGIGANTAIFSLIDAVMLKSLPVSHPEELLQVTMGIPQYPSNLIWEQIRDRQDVFSGIFGYGRWAFNLAAGGEVRNVNGEYVSGQFFDTLGVRALLGRTLTPADDKRGCAGAAVLSYGFWQREYGGRGDIVGKTISVDSHPLEIVGVTGSQFTGIDVGSSVDIFVPLCAEKILHGETSLLNDRAGWWIRIIGRPKPGISPTQVTARLKTLAPEIYKATVPQKWRVEDQDQYLKRTLDTQSAANGLSYLRQQYRQALIILMVVAGVVLLIACANMANLLLARGATRQREIAIRLALGSGRGRLIRQLLTESLLLSGIGAALGVLLADWGTSLLVRYLDVFLDLKPDVRVLAFTACVAILSGLLFGIAPAWRGTSVLPQAAMKANSRGVIEGSKFGPGKVLVMLQVALSLLLVVGALLMLSTFWNLTSLDAGFQRDDVLLTSVDLHNGNYARERWGAVYWEMLEKLRALPGVRSASLSNITPICHCRWSEELAIEGYTAKSRADATVSINQVSDQYFETLGTPILAGRDFNNHDTATSPRVAIVSRSMAQKYFGPLNPLGHYYRPRRGNKLGNPVEIVGIVKDAKYGSLRDEFSPFVFIPWSQAEGPGPGQSGTPGPLTSFALRAAGPPTALIPGVKSAIGEVNPNVSMQFTTLTAKVNESIERERLLAMLSGTFGALALLLAMIGLYGVISYNVARRRNEIGIRMAVGAEPARVLRMVLGEVALLIGIGIIVGLGASVAMTRFVTSFLYGLKPNDPLTLSLAAVMLAGVAVSAGYFPARRASRLDPMTALREE